MIAQHAETQTPTAVPHALGVIGVPYDLNSASYRCCYHMTLLTWHVPLKSTKQHPNRMMSRSVSVRLFRSEIDAFWLQLVWMRACFAAPFFEEMRSMSIVNSIPLNEGCLDKFDFSPC